MKKHIMIPDMQVKPGIDLDYCRWVGKYIADKRPDVVVNIGDFADMPSLSSYDKGKRQFEGRRYRKDVDAARKAMDLLMDPISKARGYNPRLVLTLGNHEERISRVGEYSPELDGVVGLDDLGYEMYGWEVIPYLKPIRIDGVMYCHYFVNPDSLIGSCLTGTIENRLRKMACSFSQGHQQTLLYGVRYAGGRRMHGLVAGACYMHHEEYRGPQGQDHWRGVVVKHEVRHGEYDPMLVSLSYLRKRYK